MKSWSWQPGIPVRFQSTSRTFRSRCPRLRERRTAATLQWPRRVLVAKWTLMTCKIASSWNYPIGAEFDSFEWATSIGLSSATGTWILTEPCCVAIAIEISRPTGFASIAISNETETETATWNGIGRFLRDGLDCRFSNHYFCTSPAGLRIPLCVKYRGSLYVQLLVFSGHHNPSQTLISTHHRRRG